MTPEGITTVAATANTTPENSLYFMIFSTTR
jgi:hypothetical protein